MGIKGRGGKKIYDMTVVVGYITHVAEVNVVLTATCTARIAMYRSP